MESVSNVSSEQELLKLRNDGKISDKEYEELLGTIRRSPGNNSGVELPAEPEFQAFRKRVLTGSLVLCAVGLPIGLMLDLPYVWVLAILGMIVAPVKLSRIKGSWVNKWMNKQKSTS